MDTQPQSHTDPTAVLIKRLARPHSSGGTVIERSVILAEGAHSTAILAWIADHDGTPDTTLPQSQSKGLHSPSPLAGPGVGGAQARRYILPAHAFN
jgi:hypothetical protein